MSRSPTPAASSTGGPIVDFLLAAENADDEAILFPSSSSQNISEATIFDLPALDKLTFDSTSSKDNAIDLIPAGTGDDDMNEDSHSAGSQSSSSTLDVSNVPNDVSPFGTFFADEPLLLPTDECMPQFDPSLIYGDASALDIFNAPLPPQGNFAVDNSCLMLSFPVGMMQPVISAPALDSVFQTLLSQCFSGFLQQLFQGYEVAAFVYPKPTLTAGLDVSLPQL